MVITILMLAAARAAVQPDAAPPAAEPDKVVCKFQSEANSRIPKRICLMKSEWTRIANDQEMDSSRNARSTGREGTIVNDPEGFVSGYPANANVPGLGTRPPR
jgi:hypothetical protein